MHICLSMHWNPTFEYYIFWILEIAAFVLLKVLAKLETRWAEGYDEKWTITDE